MEPVVNPLPARRRLGLRDLVGVMNGNVVHPAAVNVKMLTQIVHTHGAALDVPARIAASPGGIPDHGLALEFAPGEPEDEVPGVLLVRIRFHPGLLILLTLQQRELPVIGKLCGVEVDVSAGVVGVTGILDPLDQIDHLLNVRGRTAHHGGPPDVEAIDVVEERFREEVRDLPDALALLPGTPDDLVLTLVGVVGEVTHIGDVHDVLHLVAEVLEGASQLVFEDVGSQISDMRKVVHRGTAGVHADLALFNRDEGLYGTAEGVEQAQCHEFLLKRWCHLRASSKITVFWLA